VHRLNLLVAFGPGLFESLIFLFDPLDFTLNLFFPGIVQINLAFLVFTFEFTNLVEFCLFLDLHQGLLYRLGKEHIENRLHLALVVKKVVIAYLSDFIYAGLFGHIFWRCWSGLENVSLAFHIRLLWLCAALLGQIISQIDLNAGWGARTQVVRRGLYFLLLKLDQLGLDHLDFFLFLLVFDAEFVFLGRCHVCVAVEQVHVVGVAAENPFVVHYVEGLPDIIFVLVN